MCVCDPCARVRPCVPCVSRCVPGTGSPPPPGVFYLPIPCVPCVSRLPPVSFYRSRNALDRVLSLSLVTRPNPAWGGPGARG